jgi:hypothetical protein
MLVLWYMQVADGKIYLVKLYAPWCGELLALLVIPNFAVPAFAAAMQLCG